MIEIMELEDKRFNEYMKICAKVGKENITIMKREIEIQNNISRN